MSDLDVALRLRLVNMLSGPLKVAEKDLQRLARATGNPRQGARQRTFHARSPAGRSRGQAGGRVGGKRQLAKVLVERIASVPHQTYCEPFVGMGGVFFRRTAAPKVEVINDLN